MTTENKGGCIVVALTDTDFGAKTESFIAFTKNVAKMAYGFQITSWKDLIAQKDIGDTIHQSRNELEKEIGEKVRIPFIQPVDVESFERHEEIQKTFKEIFDNEVLLEPPHGRKMGGTQYYA